MVVVRKAASLSRAVLNPRWVRKKIMRSFFFGTRRLDGDDDDEEDEEDED